MIFWIERPFELKILLSLFLDWLAIAANAEKMLDWKQLKWFLTWKLNFDRKLSVEVEDQEKKVYQRFWNENKFEYFVARFSNKNGNLHKNKK